MKIKNSLESVRFIYEKIDLASKPRVCIYKMHVIKVLLEDCISEGPHKLEWMGYNGYEFWVLERPNRNLWIFPKHQTD